MPLLETRNLTKRFDGLAAVQGFDLTVGEGEIVGLIGPNGAGKTTCFNLLSGFLRPTAGTIRFDGEDITGLRSHRIVGRGLVRTFQLTTLFQEMTVLEHVLVGLRPHRAGPRGPPQGLPHPPAVPARRARSRPRGAGVRGTGRPRRAAREEPA